MIRANRRNPVELRVAMARRRAEMFLLLTLALAMGGFVDATAVSAQITEPRSLSGGTEPVATLDEQLINRLRATTDAQAAYIRYVVKLTDQEKLEKRLVLAIERYALRRNPRYAFPYFERALRYEAAKRGVALTSIRHFQSTAHPLH